MGIDHRGALCQGVACAGNRCSWKKCCICQTEMQNAHHAQLLHMQEKDLLVHMCQLWNRGAVFSTVACVGQSFSSAYGSCVGQRCSI